MSRSRGRLRLTCERANDGAARRRDHAMAGLVDRSTDVKYMLMMHAPRAGWKDAGIGTWPPEDIKAHIGFMIRFNKELSAAGELVGAEGLALPEEARVVRANKSGAPEVTDGPFPEAKEFLAGSWTARARNERTRLQRGRPRRRARAAPR